MLIKASIVNLSQDAFTLKRNHLDSGLQEINHLFEAIERFSLEKGIIEPLLGKMKPAEDARGGIGEAFGAYAEASVHPEDQAAFLTFTDPMTLKERIEESGKGYIESLFRVRRRNGEYRWKAFSLLMIPGTGGSEYLLCRKAIPAEANAALSKALGRRKTERRHLRRMDEAIRG